MSIIDSLRWLYRHTQMYWTHQENHSGSWMMLTLIYLLYSNAFLRELDNNWSRHIHEWRLTYESLLLPSSLSTSSAPHPLSKILVNTYAESNTTCSVASVIQTTQIFHVLLGWFCFVSQSFYHVPILSGCYLVQCGVWPCFCFCLDPKSTPQSCFKYLHTLVQSLHYLRLLFPDSCNKVCSTTVPIVIIRLRVYRYQRH